MSCRAYREDYRASCLEKRIITGSVLLCYLWNKRIWAVQICVLRKGLCFRGMLTDVDTICCQMSVGISMNDRQMSTDSLSQIPRNCKDSARDEHAVGREVRRECMRSKIVEKDPLKAWSSFLKMVTEIRKVQAELYFTHFKFFWPITYVLEHQIW